MGAEQSQQGVVKKITSFDFPEYKCNELKEYITHLENGKPVNQEELKYETNLYQRKCYKYLSADIRAKIDTDSKKDKLETTVESLSNDVKKLKSDVDIHNVRIYRLYDDMAKKSDKWSTWFD
jgi:hypothetical protein